MRLAMIGLGRMGGNMVRRRRQGGHELIVYDRSADAVKAHVAQGVKGAKGLADVAQSLLPSVFTVRVPGSCPSWRRQSARGQTDASGLAAAARSRSTSRTGGWPKCRLYSRLKWDGSP